MSPNPVPSLLLKEPGTPPAPRHSDPAVRETVERIIADVRQDGDEAVRRWSAQLDGWDPPHFQLAAADIERILSTVPQQVLDDIAFAQDQVRTFAQHQMATLSELEVETMPGVHLGHKHIPIGASAAYVPGGRFPLLASAHMTVVTAKVAGVERVTAFTPPIRGEAPAVTVAAMHLAGADEIHLLGGVQAIAAAALGTPGIGKVDLVAGPGNAYVAEAKRQLFGEVGIDLLAGPTEVVVLADETADPFVVAVDLLSQAEHGPDSPAVLITTSQDVGRAVLAEVDRLLPTLPTRDLAGPAWRDHGTIHVVDALDEVYTLSDHYAGEHVQVLTARPREALHRLRNYGSLFLGEGTCVSYGDKVIGTNHVLPTRGGARYTGGLWVGKYLKTVTYQEVADPAASARLGEVCGRAARAEGFEGHARSGDVRAARFGDFHYDWDDHRRSAVPGR